MKKHLLGVGLVAVLIGVVGVVWLRAAPAGWNSIPESVSVVEPPITTAAAPSVGALGVSPGVIGVNTPTVVTVTVQITDSTLIPGGVNLLRVDASGKMLSIVGVMRDDGLNGDAALGDKTFSFRLVLNEATSGSVYLRASVAFKGVLLRIQSPIIGVFVWNPTSSTQTPGFVVNLPPGWTVSTPTPAGRAVGLGFRRPQDPLPQEGSDVTVFIWSNPERLALGDYFDGDPGPNIPGDTAGPTEVLTVDGKPAVWYRNVVGEDTVDVLVIDDGTRYFEFDVTRGVTSLFQSILSTFKVLL